MIVHKIWTSRGTGKFYFQGVMYRHREQHWEGYFLFGILPLFVKNVKTLYMHY
jgi:hypothetical protein